MARAVTLPRCCPPHDSNQQVTKLELACVRSGRTFFQLTFLARIPLSRLQAFIAGTPLTNEERQALMRGCCRTGSLMTDRGS